jgi:hypothetical protein
MNKNLYKPLIIAVVATAVVVGPCGYVLGAKSKAVSKGGSFAAGSLNGGMTQRQGFQRGGMTGSPGAGAGTATGTRQMRGGGMTVGEVLTVSESGLTVKLADGGSRNVLLPATIAVSESKEIDRSEIKAGKFVIISGETNTDNSVTARNIQVMSVMPTVMPFRAGAGAATGTGGPNGGMMAPQGTR